ncbi:carbohydrate-binding module family 52 protein [Myriangium duriaei CBS 260.36]|uniref:Carbohydrate-binding module family 52 protein n=1 Tax=Myriangium duriaei CBS 260.36 TaxID=1168546 RepID=A0A9P4IWD3_9PEZI|nr:carbohydrate-binding module family 52 protein [Myriangium duriaei CBS 260.36]
MARIMKKSALRGALLVALQICTTTAQPADSGLQNCGFARYHPDEYTCYDGTFLCPILNGQATQRCGPDCYSPQMYSCTNGHLVQVPLASSGDDVCADTPRTLHLSDPPYENYFFSDCHSASQVVVTSPLPDSNLTIIGPRLIVAWPAGNSGVAAFFAPQSGVNGSLGISLLNSSTGTPIGPVYNKSGSDKNPIVGVQGVIEFNSSGILTLPILGSVRTIRDFTEGPSLLRPVIQDANKYSTVDDGSAVVSRLWLDNVTTTSLQFSPLSGANVSVGNQSINFSAGRFKFAASFNYPQLEQLSPEQVLAPQAQGLIASDGQVTTALSFLSYSEKLLAGAWRFLTYFGRDSMISALLMDSILSQGNASALEAVIGAALERVNRTDGSVCHEETIGDYTTFLNLQNNITSTALQCDYKMIDSDLYLPVLMKRYFLDSPTGGSRMHALLSTPAGSIDADNMGLTWGDLAQISAERIMNMTAAFAAKPMRENLLHLKDNQIVGEWRDSTYGIGGGRIPYDVNTALVPAALRAIASLSAGTNGTIFPDHPDWPAHASSNAQVWEDSTLAFFAITVPQSDAVSRVSSFTSSSSFYTGPNNTASIDSDYNYHAIALDGYNNFSTVEIAHSDDSFRHFLLNTTNQPQLTSLLNSTANLITRPFPAGLLTGLGMVVANPALASPAEADVLHANFTNSAYHGTVVWGWQMAMMARGLELQLDRCSSSPSAGTNSSTPDFCSDSVVYGNVKSAYNKLWDSIDANRQYVTSEVWSWQWVGGKYEYATLGDLPPPPGVGGGTESDIRQLWSLAFLAITRNTSL